MELYGLHQQQKMSATEASKATRPNGVGVLKKPFWGNDGFTFADVIDMVNPLQHLPVVAKYYRKISGDDCSEGARIIGDLGFGAFFGGAVGLATATANSTLRHNTTQDVSEHLMDFASHSYQSLHTTEKQQQTQISMQSEDSDNPFFAQLFDGSDEFNLAEKEINMAKVKNNTRENTNPFFAELFQYDANDGPQNQLTQVKHAGKDWGSV